MRQPHDAGLAIEMGGLLAAFEPQMQPIYKTGQQTLITYFSKIQQSKPFRRSNPDGRQSCLRG